MSIVSSRKVSAGFNAAALSKVLESVSPGLSSREVIEQSSCFVFQDDMVRTYNDGVACSAPCKLASGLGVAVTADPLMKLLKAVGNADVTYDLGKEAMEFRCPGRKFTIHAYRQIHLPACPAPQGRWRRLPDDFEATVRRVSKCASTDQSEFANTCVHCHPEWIEACDNFQVVRCHTALAVKSPFLIRAGSLKAVFKRRLTHFCQGRDWIHFRNANGLVVSCRTWPDEYPDYTPFLDTKGGHQLVLDESIVEAAQHTHVFSSENVDENQLQISLSPGKLTAIGRGASGKLKATTKAEYQGPPLEFNISPALLIATYKMISNGAPCIIKPGVMIVQGEEWTYAACLGAVEADTRKRPR